MHQRYFGYTGWECPRMFQGPTTARSSALAYAFPLHDGIPEGFRRLGPITQGGWVYNPRTELSLGVMKKQEGESELVKLGWRLPTCGRVDHVQAGSEPGVVGLPEVRPGRRPGSGVWGKSHSEARSKSTKKKRGLTKLRSPEEANCCVLQRTVRPLAKRMN
jgi:hypothetical protein